MSGDHYSRSHASHFKRTPPARTSSPLKPLLLVFVGLLVLALAAGATYFFLISAKSPDFSTARSSSSLTVMEKDALIDEKPAVEDAAPLTPTPLVARYGDVPIHLPVSTNELTEIAFHQTEVPWGLVMKTDLPAADAESTKLEHGTGRPADQPTGDSLLNGKVLHLWRAYSTTEMDTALDVGGPIGSTVYSPVDGTVVLVREYTLDNTIQDFCVHIQPTGHPELDLCVIHIDSISVVAGDKVIGGVTPIAKVRDLESFLTNIQLELYTAEGDGGNHAHVQMNDKTFENYPYKSAVPGE